jgi:hypothetical protein
MSRTKTRNNLAAVMLTVLAAMLFVGCSQTPTGSVDDGPKVLARASRQASNVAASPVNLYADTVISAEHGGRLTLLDVTLEIPAGAVPNDTLFSITIPDDEVFYNEFGTDGLVFDKPVRVTMSYRDADLSGINESTIRIGWYNEKAGRWDDMTCDVDFVNKTVTAELNHFSAYGLISD